jgi:formylglycine-generating enzyme required for sulfatase activity
VEEVSWDRVQEFLTKLNRGIPGLEARLPAEAEGEYACRAGTATAYAFGDAFDPKLANNGAETVEVRSLPPNAWGLYEMHGNVWEWCRDWYGDYPTGRVVDPVGPDTGGWRVLRGGSCGAFGRLCRAAYRSCEEPDGLSELIGFRIAAEAAEALGEPDIISSLKRLGLGW